MDKKTTNYLLGRMDARLFVKKQSSSYKHGQKCPTGKHWVQPQGRKGFCRRSQGGKQGQLSSPQDVDNLNNDLKRYNHKLPPMDLVENKMEDFANDKELHQKVFDDRKAGYYNEYWSDNDELNALRELATQHHHGEIQWNSKAGKEYMLDYRKNNMEEEVEASPSIHESVRDNKKSFFAKLFGL
jgi:hypothetical protein